MKKKILALSLILSLAALSGCNGGKSEVSDSAQTAPQTSDFTTAAPPTTESTETTEPEREIKTSAETREELIAIFLKAFCEKDTEVLRAFHCGSYDESYNEMFNRFCKALSETGNLPEDTSEIIIDPHDFEVYHQISRFNLGGKNESWEATYAPANGRFTIWFKEFTDYDYASQTYSVKSMQIANRLFWDSYLSLDDYRRLAESNQAYSGLDDREVYIETVDITPYLD